MMKIDVDYWTEVRQRIIEMRHIDFSCNMVFGSNSHKYKINRRVSERRLRAFEVKNDVELPSEYRAFLTAFGAGGAGPDYGIYSFARIGSHSVRERFHLTESCEWLKMMMTRYGICRGCFRSRPLAAALIGRSR